MATERYTDQTYQAILKRMLDRLPSDVDKREGSVAYDMVAPAAAEFAISYLELQNVLNFGFAQSTYGEFLDLRAGEAGLTRKSATKAIGKLQFTGTAGKLIPFGTKVSTNHVKPVYFLTTEEATIDSTGKVTVPAEAQTAGVLGNIAMDKATIVIGDLAGTVSVTNPEGFDGGTEIESDEDLLKRYLEILQSPQASGNVNDYIKWAQEVDGIGDAKCFPLFNGNGTVKVVVIDSTKQSPTPEKVTEVATYIETVRPVGASVTVVGAAEVPINITAKLILEEGRTLAQAQTEINESVGYYLAALAFDETLVRFHYISALILQCDSVLDYDTLTVNGGTSNITVTEEQVPVIGTVTLT
jgi:uncharacterized phage protein gp47/JayE